MKQCLPKNSMFGICEIAYFPCQPIADLMMGCVYKLLISQLLLMTTKLSNKLKHMLMCIGLLSICRICKLSSLHIH